MREQMSLNWKLDAIEDHETKCWFDLPDGLVESQIPAFTAYRYKDEGDLTTGRIQVLSTTTNSLIWHTLSVGIGRITASNYEEFYARVHLIEKLDGPMRGYDEPNSTNEPRYITLDEVKQHIGLWTNVSDETRAKWIPRIIKLKLDDFIRRAA